MDFFLPFSLFSPIQLPSFPSSTPPPPPSTSGPPHGLASLPNGPVANGTDMQVQGSSGSPKGDPTKPRPLDAREAERGYVNPAMI